MNLKSSSKGSKRRGRRLGTQFNLGGAPKGNENAKKVLEWLDTYDLSSPEGVQKFLQEAIKKTWQGELGSRQGGVINGALRLLLEHLTLPTLEKRIVELERQVKIR